MLENMFLKLFCKCLLIFLIRSLGAFVMSSILVSAANAQTPLVIEYPQFAYYMDNITSSTVTASQPSAGTVIASSNFAQRQLVTTTGRIMGHSAAFNGGSGRVLWTDATSKIPAAKGHSLQSLFNNTPNISKSDLAIQILAIAGIDVTNKDAFPQNIEANKTPSGGYVIWSQNLEMNISDNLSSNSFPEAAAAYIAVLWAGRVLLPDMDIIPVPANFIQKVGPLHFPPTSWNLSAVVRGNSRDKFLSTLKLTDGLSSQQLKDLQADKIDLLSFMHLVTINSVPLINGFLGQQYDCNGHYTTCVSLNPSSPPGSLSAETPPFYDDTLPYAIMSAHDSPNQLFTSGPYQNYPNTNQPEAPPWKSYYKGCLPFQSGVYFNTPNPKEITSFNPTTYLIPSQVASSLFIPGNNSPTNYNKFTISVQILGGSAGINGVVTSTNTAISCNSKTSLGCSQSVGAYQTVTLVANPAPGRKFLHWIGTETCKGDNPTCSLPVKADMQVGACFQ